MGTRKKNNMTIQDDNNGCYVSCSPGCLLFILIIIAIVLVLAAAF